MNASAAVFDGAEPYLSVVLTTRNDDHGGDPLKRVQAFVNCFDEQCRRFGLHAEVIVVEWNPPEDRPRVGALLRLPNPCACTYRFIEVSPDLHQQLRYADVLPLFQMIAKNVGIRRARGRFVLATNIDIILSNELVEYIASGRLQHGHLYRVDRHDMRPEFPVDAPLEEQMAYCATHQLRVHTRWGSFPVDAHGDQVCQADDIVDGCGVRLGSGWHVRENAAPGRFFRWVSQAATLIVDGGRAGIAGDTVLDLEIESNPYDAVSQVEVVVSESVRTLARTRVSGRMRVRVPLGAPERPHPRQITLRVVDVNPESRRQLPAFEWREAMLYRIYSATIAGATRFDQNAFEYPVGGWSNANPQSALTLNRTGDGLEVVSDHRKWSYCVRYGPLRAPHRDTYRFDLACTVVDGRITVGVLSSEDHFWIPSTVTQADEGSHRRFEIAVDLRAHQECSLVVFNDHPDGDGVSRFVIHQMRGRCDPRQMVVERRRRMRGTSLVERGDVLFAKAVSRLRALRSRRALKSTVAEAAARLISFAVGARLRYRIARSTPQFHDLEAALRASDEQVRQLAPLRDLADFYKLLRDRRPDNLHVNGCGDFQLMAREDWDELRAYPEFETFSMNIDGLFSYIAHAAGIKEQVLDMPIYHFEHEVGSGWSPEGEAILRKRIAERGITWLDASTVYIWASYMRWLHRPMIFNGADWGMATAQLVERTTTAVCRATS